MAGETPTDQLAARERLRIAIAECSKNSRLALAVAATAAFYQLAAVMSVTPRELLANADEMQLPLVGVSTSLTGFFIFSTVLVTALVVHLYGQLLLLAGLAGDLVREHPEATMRRDMLYPWAPLHVMVWWAAQRQLAREERRPEDSTTLYLALRITYLVFLASFTAAAFTVVLGVVLWVFKNGGSAWGGGFIALCMAVTLASGVGTMLEAHYRLCRNSDPPTRRLARVVLPCIVVAVGAWTAMFALSRERTFVGADLSGLDLARRDFEGADLRRADLTATRLRNANLRGARLQRATLALARLDHADLTGADLTKADLRAASLRGATLRGTVLSEARLHWADLTEATIVCGSWREAEGEMINLKNATFSSCDAEDGLVPPPHPSETCLDLGTARGKIGQAPSEVPCGTDRSRHAACAWLRSGTPLESVPSWLRERLPVVPSWRDAGGCDEEEAADAMLLGPQQQWWW